MRGMCGRSCGQNVRVRMGARIGVKVDGTSRGAPEYTRGELVTDDR